MSLVEPPAWIAEKAALDAHDDGHGPYMEWFMQEDGVAAARKAMWIEFRDDWAHRKLGHGFSLACLEGALIDNVTSYAFSAFISGREWNKP